MTAVSSNSTKEAPGLIESLVSRLTGASLSSSKSKDVSEANSCVSTANNSTVSLPSLLHRANIKNLGSAHNARVKEVELAEQALWKPISVVQARRQDGLFPSPVLEGRTIVRGDDRSILRHSGRRILLKAADGKGEDEEYRVVLEGFHHSSDERDRDDPSVHEPYAMVASSRWDALFDAPAGSKDVKVLAASYGVRDGEMLSKGEVGFGIKWVEEGEDVREARWSWIGGELEEQDGDEEDEGAGEKEDLPLYKGVYLVRAPQEEEDDDDNDAGVNIAVF